MAVERGFRLTGEVDQPKRWCWDEFLVLPRETITTDIHCVTKRSKFDTEWEGVSIDTLLDGVDHAASYLTPPLDRSAYRRDRDARHGHHLPRVVRNDADLDRVREYIAANPARWSMKNNS